MLESELKERIINLIAATIDLSDIKAVEYWTEYLKYFKEF